MAIRIVHLGGDDVRPEVYDDKILVPNASELGYVRGCLSSWGAFGSSRQDWKYKRGRARLKYRPVGRVRLKIKGAT